MSRPGDAHWSLLDPRSEQVVRRALDALRAHAQDHVLGGGWAVFAHAPTTPSVDCDLYVPARGRAVAEAVLRDAGLEVGAQREVELLGLEEPAEFLGFGDEDLGLPGVAFVPERLFEGRRVGCDLALTPPLRGVVVPDRPALAVAKLAALRGRSLGYLAHADGRARMLLGPALVPLMLSLAPSYYLRKASKDLFDASLLLPDEESLAALRGLAEAHGLSDAVRTTLAEVPGDVVGLADELAERVGRPPPSAWLLRARGSPS